MNNKIDPEYLKFGFNKFRCGVCGTPWGEHPRSIPCGIYRPPEDLQIKDKRVQDIVDRNQKTKVNPVMIKEIKAASILDHTKPQANGDSHDLPLPDR